MRLLSLAQFLTLASIIFAHVVYEYRYVKVDENGKVIEANDKDDTPSPPPRHVHYHSGSNSEVDSQKEPAPKPTSGPNAGQYQPDVHPKQESGSDVNSGSGQQGEIISLNPDKQFVKTVLQYHNEKRALHSASPLTWSTKLEAYAQNYANAYPCDGTLEHSHGIYGENLGVGYPSIGGSMQAWYDEEKGYDYSNDSPVYHFSALVWKKTKQVGCARNLCKGTYYPFDICSYFPAGNVAGQGRQNVSPN